MKKLLMMGICLSLMMGCQTTGFDPVVAERIATITGTSTAMVVLSIPSIATNAQTKAAISEVTKTVETVVPGTNQSFAAAAAPVVNAAVNRLVAEKRLDAMYAPLVKEGTIIVFSGVDLVMAKYPNIKSSTDDVNLVVKSFFVAFNSTFNPVILSVAQPSQEISDTVKELKEKNKVILDKLTK